MLTTGSDRSRQPRRARSAVKFETTSASTGAELRPGVQRFSGILSSDHMALEPSGMNESFCQPIRNRLTDRVGKHATGAVKAPGGRTAGLDRPFLEPPIAGSLRARPRTKGITPG